MVLAWHECERYYRLPGVFQDQYDAAEHVGNKVDWRCVHDLARHGSSSGLIRVAVRWVESARRQPQCTARYPRSQYHLQKQVQSCQTVQLVNKGSLIYQQGRCPPVAAASGQGPSHGDGGYQSKATNAVASKLA